MKSFILCSLLVTPALSQFCFNSEPVRNCAIDAENSIRYNCGGNPQCVCSESQRLKACFIPCESDPNLFEQIASVNAQVAQYCNGGGFGMGPIGAFPSAIPGVVGSPTVQSANVNSKMLEATATFRSGVWNSRGYVNSDLKLTPILILPLVLIIGSVTLI